MTPIEQGIACAELCGWVCCDESPEFGKLWWRKGLQEVTTNALPDYTEDWNTRPEMLRVVIERGLEAKFYACIAGPKVALSQKIAWKAIGMSQPQFAECFLRATGRWKEGA